MPSAVTLVRIYLTETDKERLQRLQRLLHDEHRVRGLTIFRGISGFGQSGEMHNAQWVDLQFDLPLVLEFFDESSKIEALLPLLAEHVEPQHMVYWAAQTNA